AWITAVVASFPTRRSSDLNCYAERTAIRQVNGVYKSLVRSTVNGPRWTGKVARASEETLFLPMTWKAPRRVFVNSKSDLFHEDRSEEHTSELQSLRHLVCR